MTPPLWIGWFFMGIGGIWLLWSASADDSRTAFVEFLIGVTQFLIGLWCLYESGQLRNSKMFWDW